MAEVLSHLEDNPALRDIGWTGWADHVQTHYPGNDLQPRGETLFTRFFQERGGPRSQEEGGIAQLCMERGSGGQLRPQAARGVLLMSTPRVPKVLDAPFPKKRGRGGLLELSEDEVAREGEMCTQRRLRNPS